MDISDRKRAILAAVVTLHTDTGDPVGSGILTSLLRGFTVSSATLRNEMAELTSLGLLEQPHTSAGRVPTTGGFRYYVDNLMSAYAVSPEEKRGIDRAVGEMDSDPWRAAEASVKSLAAHLGLAAVGTTPRAGVVQIIHFEVLPVGRYNVALLGVTSAGSVMSRVTRLPAELTPEQLEAAERALNEQMVFVAAPDLGPERLRAVAAADGFPTDCAARIAEAAAAIINSAGEVRVFTAGQENLLAYRELDGELKPIMEFFSNTRAIRTRLENLPAPITVYVGEELRAPDLERLSLIAGRYRASGGRQGGLGVVGPARMNYAYIIPRLRYFCEALSGALTECAT